MPTLGALQSSPAGIASGLSAHTATWVEAFHTSHKLIIHPEASSGRSLLARPPQALCTPPCCSAYCCAVTSCLCACLQHLALRLRAGDSRPGGLDSACGLGIISAQLSGSMKPQLRAVRR